MMARMPPDAPAPRERRPLLTATAGLVVAVLAAGAFALTYDPLREFAQAGGASRRWAPVYPVMTDALVVMTILSLVVARTAPWWSRWLRGALLLLLVTGTAAIAVQHTLWGFASIPADPHRVGIAVAPHLMLVIAVWLWFRMFRHRRPPKQTPPPPPSPESPPKPTPPPLALDDKPEPTRVSLDEQPDEDEDLPIWDWNENPPSSSLRSSPVPPADEG